jgi:hypothetical protein
VMFHHVIAKLWEHTVRPIQSNKWPVMECSVPAPLECIYSQSDCYTWLMWLSIK